METVEPIQVIEIIGTLDVDLLMQYFDMLVVILLALLFVVCLTCGIMIGHYLIYRIRG